MRILLDTNIFVSCEQDHVVSHDLTKLLQILTKSGAKLVIHPLSVSEIRSDLDIGRREVNLSKTGTYSHLESPPDPNSDKLFCDLIGSAKNARDEIDNAKYTWVMQRGGLNERYTIH